MKKLSKPMTMVENVHLYQDDELYRVIDYSKKDFPNGYVHSYCAIDGWSPLFYGDCVYKDCY